MTSESKTTPIANYHGSESVLELRDVSICYSGNPAVQNVSLNIFKYNVTSIIGPSGCGKSTLLRSLNRMNDFIADVTIEGSIKFDGVELTGKEIDPVLLRRRVGMVFQKPNPFPKSIYKNIAWGPGINGYEGSMDDLVEHSLVQAALWDEVKDRLQDSALSLSGGQQQRLCIARALAMAPDVLLMDEPCSALDPISTSRIEDLIFALKSKYTIVIVTHNMQQAARISDYTAFMESGKLVEFDITNQIFTNPTEKRTEEYVTGRFG
ncbi:MAG: phosphate ABC transporter ATP-binding protein [Pseudomonadales bacterium]|nr:phosphate ABC transporter ATP-binding protein [Pseudomonadales bacterium]